MNGKKSSALRSLKRMIDTASGFIQKTSEDIPKITTKGYPAEMVIFYESKLESVTSALKFAKDFYATEVMTKDEADTTKINDVDATLKAVEAEIQALEKVKKTFDASYGSDLKKLTSAGA